MPRQEVPAPHRFDLRRCRGPGFSARSMPGKRRQRRERPARVTTAGYAPTRRRTQKPPAQIVGFREYANQIAQWPLHGKERNQCQCEPFGRATRQRSRSGDRGRAETRHIGHPSHLIPEWLAGDARRLHCGRQNQAHRELAICGIPPPFRDQRPLSPAALDATIPSQNFQGGKYSG